MNKSISNVLQIEVLATCPKVALIVPITLEVSINSSQQSVAPNVKLPVFVEKRLLEVLLNDVGPLLAIDIGVRYDFLDLREFPADLNATAPISVFTGLDNPNLLS
jgi:hypothetical protein